MYFCETIFSSGSRISQNGVHMYIGMAVGVADFLSFFLNVL